MSEGFHPLLLRQLKRSGVDPEQLPEHLLKFIASVDGAYKSSDQDRLLLERSLELSAKEIYEQYEEMRATLESLPQIDIQSGPAKERMSFRELFLAHVEKLKSSKDSITKQAELLREQAFELAVARDEALESSKTKSAFLANMSHEIRTPMNATLGMLKIVLGTELSQEQREYLTLAEQSSFGLLSLIEDILDLSKIEAGKLDIEHIEFKPRHAIKSALATVYNQSASKGIELLADIDHGIPGRLIGDPNRLKQVLINLISNAVKFTRSGYVQLKIRCVRENPEGLSTILFSVKDTGIGIGLEKQTTIFNAFQQGDESVTRKFGGTGLGLSISQQIVNLLGGHINLRSVLGEGSEFFFELSLPWVKEGNTLIMTRENSYDNEKFTILSENKILSETVETYLSDFSSGKICVQSLSYGVSRKFLESLSGIVFLDMGFGLTSENKMLLESLAKSDSKIIALAPMADLSEKENLLALGAKVVLFKPFIDSDMATAIRRAFSVTDKKEINTSGSYLKPDLQRSLRIVVVDDLHVNRLVAQKTLEQRGHEVVCFEGGKILYQHLERHLLFSWERSGQSPDCDLILLDVQMPELDGMETAQLIRKWEKENRDPGSAPLTIVALTAHALKGDRERFIESGMDDYLRKPIDSDALSLLLNKIKQTAVDIPPDNTVGGESSVVQKTAVIFDKELMLSRFCNDWGIIKEIVVAYLEEEDELNRKLDASLGLLDSESIRMAAHALKGSLLDVGGTLAGSIAGELETAARDKKGGYHELREKLKEKSQLLNLELEKMLEQVL